MAVIFAYILCFLFFFAIWPNDNEFSTTTTVRNWVRAILAIGLVIFFCIFFVTCNREKEFNDKAKIYGLGCYDNESRIAVVRDSLCKHNCVKFGKLLFGPELGDRYGDNSMSNYYIVGCRDTISGDVLEIELEVYSRLNEDVVTEYANRITKITLKNANGIAKSNYSIDSDYLSGGSGFEKGYCAEINDTCAMIYIR